MDSPHIKLTTMAVERVRRRTGTINVIANKNFVRNVAIVATQTCLVVWVFTASSETWIPKASENASAMAIVKIPARTTILECVPEWRPTMRPRVVMIADVNPNEMPLRNESFNCVFSLSTQISASAAGVAACRGICPTECTCSNLLLL